MTYAIAWEPLSVLVASGLEDLAVAHWEEVEIDKEHVPLALDLERARAFEKVGQHATAALRREGVLVGYAAFTLMTAMFHRHTLHAFCSAVYVDPASRGPASLWLIDWCEKALADRGVVKIYIGSKQVHCRPCWTGGATRAPRGSTRRSLEALMSGGGGQAPVPFQPPNQAGAASAFQAGAEPWGSQGNALYGQANSGFNQLYQQALTNPYYGQAQNNANQAGQTGQAFGQQEMGYGQGLANLAGSLGQYAPAIAQTAFDPQNALYNRTQGQITNQANATAAQSGLAGSPFGAGLTNQANENFNIDWQNNQPASARTPASRHWARSPRRSRASTRAPVRSARLASTR